MNATLEKTENSYRCRFLIPLPVEICWVNVKALSAEEAAIDLHHGFTDGLKVLCKPHGVCEKASFALVEVEGHGSFITRQFHSGIWRKGGVSRRDAEQTWRNKLKEIADQLGWTQDPILLLEPGWEHEENEFHLDGEAMKR